MSTQKVNLYINSVYKNKDETNSKLKVVIPTGLLNLQGHDYYTMSVTAFSMYNTFYQLHTDNNSFAVFYKDLSNKITDAGLMNITCIGNPNVYQIRDDLNELLSDLITVDYDKISNTFTYTRVSPVTDNQHKIYIYCYGSGTFMGLDNNVEIEIPVNSLTSDPINVVAHRQLLFSVEGDIQFPQNNLDNSEKMCTPNNVLFVKDIDKHKNELITYENIDANASFQFRLTATETINQFMITVVDQDYNIISDLPNWQMTLQFQKCQDDNTESLLTQIKDYLRYIFLIIANYSNR